MRDDAGGLERGSVDGSQWALVLAGGDGTRLNDLTQELYGKPVPKQYCRFYGEGSLLELTLRRTGRFAPPSRSIVVVNQDHLAVGAGALSALTPRNMLVQPCNRDTGPGIVYSLLRLLDRHPDPLVAMFPSDHYVGDDARFMGHVAEARQAVANRPEKIALLGIRPHFADAGLGYITVGDRLESGKSLRTVESFAEKPSVRRAVDLIAHGALWNSFVMVFHARRVLDLIDEILPEDLARIRALARTRRPLGNAYGELRSWNFSGEFLQRIAAHLVAVPVEGVDWSDLGTRSAVERLQAQLAPRSPASTVTPSLRMAPPAAPATHGA